jgi:hypothetical protein
MILRKILVDVQHQRNLGKFYVLYHKINETRKPRTRNEKNDRVVSRTERLIVTLTSLIREALISFILIISHVTSVQEVFSFDVAIKQQITNKNENVLTKILTHSSQQRMPIHLQFLLFLCSCPSQRRISIQWI